MQQVGSAGVKVGGVIDHHHAASLIGDRGDPAVHRGGIVDR